ncbi:MAG TPA: hypothetical protein VN776_13515 [Terracidiphilus sp.]|nr:hypothetical protein [Terracidiphilus sp.]
MNPMRALMLVVLLAGVVFEGVPAFAVEGKEAAYVAGTGQTVKEGTVGVLNTSSATALVFESSGGQISIPYARVVSYQYRQEVKVHLGVLPAIAVGLVKRRAKRHFVTITWKGDGDQREVVTLEVSKTEPEILLGLLRALAPEPCRAKPGLPCGSSAAEAHVTR